MKSPTVLVTGAAGFIGSHLSEQLFQNGHSVIGIDNFDPYYNPSIKRSNLEKCIDHPDFSFLEGDIRDKAFLDRLFGEQRIDVVIHLAAKAGVRSSIAHPLEYADVNVRGTLCLLEAMRSAGVSRMLFASSSSVYGNQEKVPFSETDPVDRPISPYAATKLAGELLCHTYHALHGFDIWCLRFFTVYGPRQRPEMAIARFLSAALSDRTIHMYGDGTMQRDFTFITDIIEGITRSLKALRGFEIVNLGGSRTISLSELISKIEQTTAIPLERIIAPVPPGDVRRTIADQHRSTKLIGEFTRTMLEEGLARQWDWIRKQPEKY